MIYCYSKNFIFVKTHKTASTSAEILLSSLCNDEDYFTPIINYDETLKNLNYALDNNLDELVRKKYTKLLPKVTIGKHKIFDHMTAKEIKNIDPVFFNQAFKFCVERHPYDRVISHANHKIDYFKINKSEYNELINHIINVGGCSNKDMYVLNQKIIVDKIVQFNNLEEFLIDFCRKNGKISVVMPKTKQYTKHVTLKNLTTDQKFQIYKLCEWEFKTFNYANDLDLNVEY